MSRTINGKEIFYYKFTETERIVFEKNVGDGFVFK